MRTRNPYEHKRLGNLIDQPTQEWRDGEEALMSRLLRLKFTQNPFLNMLLINTGEKSLHEATGDRKWATGSDLLSNATKNNTWTGNDLLGRLLSDLRTSLLNPNSTPTPSPANQPPIPTQVDSLSPMPEDDPEVLDPLDDPPLSALDLSTFKTQTIPLNTHPTPHLPPQTSQAIKLSADLPSPSQKLNSSHSTTTSNTPNTSSPLFPVHSPPPHTSLPYPPPTFAANPWHTSAHVITQQPMSPAPPPARFQKHTNKATATSSHSQSQSVLDIRRSTRVRSSNSQR